MTTAPNNKNIPYYLITAGLFILLKFGFTLSNNDNLTFLLRPTNKFIELLTASKAVYNAENGFYHEKLNILIDKSCSGFNFWVLSFLIFSYLILKYLQKPYKMLNIPISLIFAYFLTIFSNTSRIFAAIITHQQSKNLLPDEQHLLHEAIGIITNLSFLVLAYYTTEQILINLSTRITTKNNAQFTQS